MAELGAKPVPFIVTIVPTGPLVGKSVIFADTGKLTLTEWELASVATTGCAPNAEFGTVKLAEKEPVVSVFAGEGTVTWVTPLYFIVIAEAGA
jgi:hypothetical protein